MRAAALAFLFLLVSIPTGARSSRPPEPETSIRSWILSERFALADSAAQVVLARVRSKTPVDSLALAHALDLVARARVLGDIGKVEENEALAEQALRIKETRLRPADPEIAVSASNVAEALRTRGRYADALKAFQRSLTIRASADSAENPELAGALNDVAKTLRDLGRTKEARPLFERALALREKTLGPDDPELAVSLANLGSVVRDAGETARAWDLYERALAIRERAFGHDHPSVARVLQLEAVLLRRAGDYAGARRRYEDALAIAESTLPPGHPGLGRYHSSVGAIDYAMADYGAARQEFEADLALNLKAFGPEHPGVAAASTNLGVIALELGDFAAAADRFRASLAISEKTRGRENVSVALALNNLGIALNGMGRYAEADSVHALAVQTWEKVEGDSSANVAISLEGRADDAAALGDDAHARAYSARALSILDRIDPHHPEIPGVLENLGALAARRRDYADARDAYARALEIRRAQLGSSHPLVARALSGEARALLGLGDREAALASALEAERIRRDHIRSTVRWLPERQALRFENLLPSGLDVAVTVAVEPGAADSFVARTWDALVRSRALVLDEMAARRREREASDRGPQAEVDTLERRTAESRRRFVGLALRGPSDESPQMYQARLDSARAASESAEQDLLTKNATSRRTRARENAGLDRVLSALPPDAALVSFVRYEDPLAALPRYAAFVRDPEGRVRAIALGRATAIDSLVERWRARAGRGPSARYAVEDANEESKRSQALRARTWDPIEPLTGAARRVVVVPDGALHLVNFAALRRTNGRYLAEQGPTFEVVTVERNLVPTAAEARPGGGFLVLGDPDFDARGEAPAAAQPVSIRRGALPCALSLRQVRWERLPGAEHEVADIEKLWSSLAPGSASHLWRLTGAAASEDAFKKLAPSARFVHLATHAFFFDACPDSGRDATRGVGGMALAAASRHAQPPTPAPAQPVDVDDNPLLRAGFALAGANTPVTDADSTREDGILTAEEIARMDLSSVESAVLSGCDTGVGALRAGEGVLGLRRAFEIAGAQSLVLSLWPVSDEAAREWMERFYEARLRRGAAAADAAREASRSMLTSRRASGRSVHPYYWAAFIATGPESSAP